MSAFDIVAKAVRRIPFVRRWLPAPIAHGVSGIREAGHRLYVGGLWDEIGPMQLHTLVRYGLEPHHVFLDIGCGSLRGGVHFIDYLEPGNYLGLDKEIELIQAGVEEELEPEIAALKRPTLVAASDFPFDDLPKRPDFALAHSLFTHLPAELISLCLTNLRPVIKANGELFATFFESRFRPWRARQAHDHRRFDFTRKEMLDLGRNSSWESEYIGDWGHPRGQVLVRYRASSP